MNIHLFPTDEPLALCGETRDEGERVNPREVDTPYCKECAAEYERRHGRGPDEDRR